MGPLLVPRPPPQITPAPTLHMSYTVSPATAAAVSASISTPVCPTVLAMLRTATEWEGPSSDKLTSTCGGETIDGPFETANESTWIVG